MERQSSNYTVAFIERIEWKNSFKSSQVKERECECDLHDELFFSPQNGNVRHVPLIEETLQLFSLVSLESPPHVSVLRCRRPL